MAWSHGLKYKMECELGWIKIQDRVCELEVDLVVGQLVCQWDLRNDSRCHAFPRGLAERIFSVYNECPGDMQGITWQNDQKQASNKYKHYAM